MFNLKNVEDMENLEKLTGLLKINNVKKINLVTELIDLIYLDNIDSISNEKIPKSIVKKASIIVVDNEIFNETYLIDIFNYSLGKIIKENNIEKISDLIDIYYIDDFKVKECLYNKNHNLVENPNLTDLSKHDFEMHYLKPCVIFLSPELDDIYVVKEFISVIMESTLYYNINDFISHVLTIKP